MNKEALKRYFYKHIVSTTLNLVLVPSILLGGMVFIFYYASIGYFPHLNFADSLDLLFAVAIAFLFVIIVLILGLVVPRLMAGDYGSTAKAKEFWKGEKQGVNIGLLTWFGIPMFLVSAILFIAIASNISDITIILGFLTLYFVLLVVFAWLACKKPENKKISYKEAIKKYGLWIHSSVILVGSLLIFTPFFIAGAFFRSWRQEYEQYWLFESIWGTSLTYILIFVILLMTNIATINESKSPTFKTSLLSGSFLLFLLFFIFGGWNIPNKIMERYKFGNFIVDEMIFHNEACKAIRLSKLQSSIFPKHANSKFCKLSNVKVLSSLGKYNYLSITQNGKELKFIIQSEQIQPWVIEEDKVTDKNNKTDEVQPVSDKENID